jgi:adenylate kinase family enzyme
MKKVLIIGCPGSGKSYFSRELAAATGLPLYHIDKIRWRTDWTLMPREEFLPILREIMERDEWIIDGNYLNSMEYRLGYADTVFYFDLPTEECLANVEQRKGKPREDMPDGMIDREDPEFIEFIKNFNSDTKPRVEELLSRFRGEVIVIKSREDKIQYLQ